MKFEFAPKIKEFERLFFASQILNQIGEFVYR